MAFLTGRATGGGADDCQHIPRTSVGRNGTETEYDQK